MAASPLARLTPIPGHQQNGRPAAVDLVESELPASIISQMTARDAIAPPDAVERSLEVSAALDVRFHTLRGDSVVTNKERAFRELFRALETNRIEYALIGGLAVQLCGEEARTTLDIDVAVKSYDSLPRPALEAAGFRFLGRHAHSENWTGPDDTPVQFSDDPAFARAIETAEPRRFEESIVRVATAAELVHSKLRAAGDDARRRSKRLRDLADAQALLELHPEVSTSLTEAERAVLSRAL